LLPSDRRAGEDAFSREFGQITRQNRANASSMLRS